MKVLKRDGSFEEFMPEKILNAINGANSDLKGKGASEQKIQTIYYDVICKIKNDKYLENYKNLSVEDINDLIETTMMELGSYTLAKQFIEYRYLHKLIRESNTTDDTILSMLNDQDEYWATENSNKDVKVANTQRDYMAGIVSKDISERILLPKDLIDAHKKGIIHIHDLDYFAQRIFNCDLVNLEDMLQNGTCLSGTLVEKPKSFRTACTVATQIIAQVAGCQHGGQTITLSHLAPFVDISRQKYIKRTKEELTAANIKFSEEQVKQIAEEKVKHEIKDGVQTIQYQIQTLLSVNGQSPFISIFMYLNEVEDEKTRDDLALIIEEVLKQRIEGVKNEKGIPITTAFPKLLYCLDENNITEDSKYWYLTTLAAECSSKRLVPDYISAKKMKELKEGDVFPCMGCRSFLSPWKDENGKSKYYGRFNLGVCTINLVDVALSSKGDMNLFWKILDERLLLCKRMGIERYKRLKDTTSDIAPILWQHGAIARLGKGEKIEKYLLGGYSTVSVGYAGLYECVKYMTNKSHTDPEATPFALSIIKHMQDLCNLWKIETRLGYALYGTPLENTTYKFAKCLKDRFGVIPGVTDKNYITNSYHVTPKEHIDAFSKLKFESQFQGLSLGGAISYIETPNLTKNIDVILEVIKYIYDTIMYAEINTTTSYCHNCGCTDISMGDDLKYHCPQCGNDDFEKMNIAVRICGYISTHLFNKGRAEDIHDRVYHLGEE